MPQRLIALCWYTTIFVVTVTVGIACGDETDVEGNSTASGAETGQKGGVVLSAGPGIYRLLIDGKKPQSDSNYFLVVPVTLTNDSADATIPVAWGYFEMRTTDNVVSQPSPYSEFLDDRCRNENSIAVGGEYECSVAFEVDLADEPDALRYTGLGEPVIEAPLTLVISEADDDDLTAALHRACFQGTADCGDPEQGNVVLITAADGTTTEHEFSTLEFCEANLPADLFPALAGTGLTDIPDDCPAIERTEGMLAFTNCYADEQVCDYAGANECARRARDKMPNCTD